MNKTLIQMRRGVLWNGTLCCAKRLGFVGVFVALLCVFLVDLLEGNRWIPKETSYANGPELRSQFIDPNTQPVLCYQKEFERNAIAIDDFNLLCLKSKDCEKQGLQENLSKSYRSNDHQRTFLRKLKDRLQWRACPRPTSSGHTHGSSPSMVKRPIRTLLTSPQDLVNPDHHPRPSRKLAEIGGGGGPVVLIIAVVSTVVVTLGIFALFLFYCGGRDALKPANGPAKEEAKGQAKEEANGQQDDDKHVVNLRSKGYKGKLGSLQKSLNKVSLRSNTNNFLTKTKTSLHLSRKAAPRSSPTSTPPPPPTPPPPTPPNSSPPPPSTPPPTDSQTTSPPASPAAPPPPPPPPPKPSAPKPPPPPPPRPSAPKPPPNPSTTKKPPASGSQRHTIDKEENKQAGDSEGTQTRLKPFFWDKVNAVQNRSMVWHHLRDGSFQLDEEMMVGLFGYVAAQNKKERAKIDSNLQNQNKLIQIIDAKKAQNLAILLKALNVTTEEVCDAVKKGNQLPVELISTLLKMAPTQEEELKLRLYSGDLSQLGPSERFLKNLVEIPFAFKRLEALLFMSSFQEDYHMAKVSFATLEAACNKLRSSRLFLRLLEAVLKTGNRMNDGTYCGGAQAFKLDTLLKLSDVKGTDGKTTLLSFVVQEIIRYEGIKVARNRNSSAEDAAEESPEYLKELGLEVVSKLSTELDDVKKAAVIDGDNLSSTVSRLGTMLKKTKDFVNEEMKTAEAATESVETLTRFLEHAEADVTWMIEEEKRIMSLVKGLGDYFHGKSGKEEGLRLFGIIRDFLRLLDNTCNDVRKALAMETRRNEKKDARRSRAPRGSEEKDDEESMAKDDETTGSHKKKRRGLGKAWQNTRDKILIMKDTIRIILESIYDDESEQTQNDEMKDGQSVPGKRMDNSDSDERRIPSPPPAPAPASGEVRQHLFPNVRDKLALLTINHQQMDDSDSDSDGWSSDEQAPTASGSDHEGFSPNARVLEANKDKQGDDPDGWGSDEEMKHNQKEKNMPAASEETRQPPSSLSDAIKDDDEKLESAASEETRQQALADGDDERPPRTGTMEDEQKYDLRVDDEESMSGIE